MKKTDSHNYRIRRRITDSVSVLFSSGFFPPFIHSFMRGAIVCPRGDNFIRILIVRRPFCRYLSAVRTCNH